MLGVDVTLRPVPLVRAAHCLRVPLPPSLSAHLPRSGSGHTAWVSVHLFSAVSNPVQERPRWPPSTLSYLPPVPVAVCVVVVKCTI